MLEFFGLFAEMFSFLESVSFIWLFTFSKNYRKDFSDKWNGNKVGIESRNKIILGLEIIFSILFNILVIGVLVYYSFFF